MYNMDTDIILPFNSENLLYKKASSGFNVMLDLGSGGYSTAVNKIDDPRRFDHNQQFFHEVYKEGGISWNRYIGFDSVRAPFVFSFIHYQDPRLLANVTFHNMPLDLMSVFSFFHLPVTDDKVWF